ncbi:succinate dehydrogenase assembly factor 2 [Sulfitobacter sp. HNIBRBA2951]|uniref:succinate dehydrogenase assembly factor 2 n=1 Tax=Sulfitobacter aquimarinus TaxID=3158557 RepID=UPI0032DF9D66
MFEMPRPDRPENEPREVRIKRLAMRSMRRGIKEMDLILQAFATDSLDKMSAAELETYDDLLDENDHDLYQWVTGQFTPKPEFEPLIEQIKAHISKS